jgi:hypothetical protein
LDVARGVGVVREYRWHGRLSERVDDLQKAVEAGAAALHQPAHLAPVTDPGGLGDQRSAAVGDKVRGQNARRNAGLERQVRVADEVDAQQVAVETVIRLPG